ncbi:MAG: hypothetical protein JWR26_2846 [Pedosphaera sp.]|nr:hypothetical protein [Pedosphaera sp.]
MRVPAVALLVLPHSYNNDVVAALDVTRERIQRLGIWARRIVEGWESGGTPLRSELRGTGTLEKGLNVSKGPRVRDALQEGLNVSKGQQLFSIIFFVGVAFSAEKACRYWVLLGLKKNKLKSMSVFSV